MSFKKYKLNKDRLGKFGEFIYSEYVKKNKFKVKQINMWEIDLELIKDEKSYCIDVKTSYNKKGEYKGTRHRNHVIYEQVYISDNYFKIFPDKNSPLRQRKEIIINEADTFFKNWKNKKNDKKSEDWKNILKKTTKLNLKQQGKSLFFLTNGMKIRVVGRGPVNFKRWSAKPDNVPGKETVIKNFFATAFIQLKYKNQNNKDQNCLSEVEVSEIVFIPHNQLNRNIQLIDSKPYQKKKGFLKIINWMHFKSNNKNFIFDNINEFKNKIFDLKYDQN